MTSYHEFNKYDKAKQLVEMMKEGKNIAIITDAGTPGISDPGEEVVRQCFEAGIQVTSLPGPAACITALTMSGQKTRRFCFEAFLPKDKKENTKEVIYMENASKALIIAGAILLAILIISLGIMIYQQASGVVNNNSMTEVDVSTFNSKFEQYLGSNVRGAQVNALINTVNTNNMSQDDTSKKVTVKGNTTTAAQASDYKKDYKTGSTYSVTVTKNTKGGLISEITIAENQ